MDLLKNLIHFIRSAEDAGQIPGWLAHDWVYILTGVVLLITILTSFWNFASWIFRWRQRRFLINDLAPYFTKAEVYKATNNYIPTKFQNVAPSEDEEPGRKFIASAKGRLIPLFLKEAFKEDKDDNKYYLLLADAGMGKTTFMINLYLSYKRKWRLWGRKFDIRLFPLGHPHALDDIAKIDDDTKKDTILLLDALDEDGEAVKNYQKRLKEILDKSWRFREVVITCRTQFFPSRKEEPTETGYFKFGGEGGEYKFQKLYVSVFDDRDINRYLLKRFRVWNPFIWKKLRKARAIVKQSPNLMVRPMLLSHIEELVGHKKEYEWTYEIYEVLIEKWVEREANKPGIKARFGSVEQFKKQLLAFSQSLAVNLYFNQSERGGFYIHKDEKVSTDSGIQLSDLENNLEIALKESQWRSRSLLNRNAEGYYKFSHKSVLEYFLAKEAIENPSFTGELNFEGLDQAKRFCEEMVIGVTLKKTKGSFKLAGAKKEQPLDELNKKNYDKIETLKIESGHRINLHAIPFFLPDRVREITIIDKNTFPNLYRLYIYYISIQLLNQIGQQGQLGLLKPEEIGNIFDELGLRCLLGRLGQLSLLDLLVMLRLSLRDLLNLIDLLSRRGREGLHDFIYDSSDPDWSGSLGPVGQVELLKKLNLLELCEWIEPLSFRNLPFLPGTIDLLDWRGLINQLDQQDPGLIEKFHSADEFIKKCQALSS